MTTRTAIIASTVGLHARPAALFTKLVAEKGVPVTIGRPGGKEVNAASMLAVMSLGIRHGEEAELRCDAPEADALLEELVAFLETNHDEEAEP